MMRLRASKLPRRWSVWKRKAGMEPRTHPLSLQEQCWLLRPHRKAGFQKRGASVPADAKAVGGRMMNGVRVLPATLPLASGPALSAHPVGLHGLHSQPAPQLWSPHVQQVGPAGWAGAVLAEGRAARLCRKPRQSCSSHQAGDGHKFSISKKRLQGSQETMLPVPRSLANSTCHHTISSTSPSIRPPDEFHLHRESVKIVPIA